MKDRAAGGGRPSLHFFRISSLGALRVLTRASGQLEPQVDLGKLLGARAGEARGLIPKIRARLEHPPLSRGLYGRLVDSKRGGLGRYSSLRNKAVHWMAPVPTSLAVELLGFYRRVLGELIPLVAAQLLRVAPVEERPRLERWSGLLRAAAEGEVSEAFGPLRYRRAVELLAGSVDE